jgi:hypothetical protein
MAYRLAKIFHLLGLVTWLGPSTGGYLLVLLARHEASSAATLWLLVEYTTLIHVEAAGLGLLIASGAAMRLLAPTLKHAGWLKIKILKVFCVVVPLEAGQLVIYHRLVRPAAAAGEGVAEALRVFDLFSLVAVVILAPTVAGIFYLAVFRPPIRRMEKGR